MDSLNSYEAELQRANAARTTREPSWLKLLRGRASDRFHALGFPTTADEEWRFTSVAPIAGGRFELAQDGAVGAADLAAFLLPDTGRTEIVFVNGRYRADLSRRGSLPQGARVESLAPALADRAADIEPFLGRGVGVDREAFAALNTAFLSDGAYVHVPANATLEAPIHVVFVSSAVGGCDTMTHPRVLLVFGENSRASIVESYVEGHAGDGVKSSRRYFTNAVTEVVVGEGAAIDHYKVQRESPAAYHVAAMHVLCSRSAVFGSHSIGFGGAIVRNDITATLDGEGAECTLNGLYLGDGSRLVDNHTTIDHARPHCDSREVYKGILADRARAVFNGKIVVRPDAQKTDAKQTNKALLLSEEAQINTKPQLEIFANDVKCTHGAAVGQMDDDALFYLRARGLKLADARNLLIHAFAGDILNRIKLAPLRERLDLELMRRLQMDGLTP
jgi:Fe-S cluster assembly protein SufD